MVKKYNDYLIDSLFENTTNIDEIFLIISDELKNILKRIKHPIAEEILLYNIDGLKFNVKHFKATFLDVVNKVDSNGNEILDLISFVSSNKVIQKAATEMNLDFKNKEEILKQFQDIILHVYRNRQNYKNIGHSETTIGRIVNKLFEREYPASGEPGKDIESFVNMYKTARNPIVKFELVKGDDIIYWYNYKQYADGGALADSCMRYDKCSKFLKFYANNENVSLLILKDELDETKIRGRALVWKLDNPSGRYFMDRIFYTTDYIIDLFKQYADKNGWIYKINQNNSSDGPFFDTHTISKLYDFQMVVNMNDTHYYPYLDTLKYYTDNKLTNIETDDYEKKLTKTDGTYRTRGVWSEYYDEYINPEDGNYNMCLFNNEYRLSDDSFYSEFYGGYIANDYAEDYGCWCDHSYDLYDRWRKDNDCIQLANGEYSDKDYAENNFEWSDYLNKYVVNGVWSDYYNGTLERIKSQRVYTNIERTETDWRIRNDNTYKSVSNYGYYDNNINSEDILKYNLEK